MHKTINSNVIYAQLAAIPFALTLILHLIWIVVLA